VSWSWHRKPPFSSGVVEVFGREDRKPWPGRSTIKWTSEMERGFDKGDKGIGK
jgi:hypothetical protein